MLSNKKYTYSTSLLIVLSRYSWNTARTAMLAARVGAVYRLISMTVLENQLIVRPTIIFSEGEAFYILSEFVPQ